MHLDAFWAWCSRLPKQAINVQLYLSHLKFVIMAAGEHQQMRTMLVHVAVHE